MAIYATKYAVNVCLNRFKFLREARMTPVGFISQVGGLMGLCLGFSLLSFIELVYWFTYRMGKNL